MTTPTNNYYSVYDVAKALGCALNTARDMLKDTPFEMQKNKKNNKMQRMFHQDVVLPLCVRYKRNCKPPKGYLSLAEATARAGKHSSCIYKLMRAGTIKCAFMANGRKVVDEKSLEEYIARKRRTKIAKAVRALGVIRYLLNQLRPALYGDSASPDRIADDSRALLISRINALTSKLNELKEIIA